MPSTVGGAAGQPGASSTGGLDKLDQRGLWSRQARPAGAVVSTSSTSGDQESDEELDEVDEDVPAEDEVEESVEVDEVVEDELDEAVLDGVLLLDAERLSVR